MDVNYRNLVNDIKVGDTVLVDNGLIRFEVLEKDDVQVGEPPPQLARQQGAGDAAAQDRHVDATRCAHRRPPFTEITCPVM